MMQLTNAEKKTLISILKISYGCELPIDEQGKLWNLLSDHLEKMDSLLSFLWRLSVFIIEYFSVPRFGKVFSNLGQNQARNYINWFQKYRFFMLIGLRRFVETVLAMNYYSLESVKKQVGYNPDIKKIESYCDYPSFAVSTTFEQEHEDVDVCVIGSGAGGSVAAWRMAKRGLKVLVIEEGKWFSNSKFGGEPLGQIKEMYRNAGVTPTIGRPFILVPEGKCVGGTTTINSGTCFRTPDKVLHSWVRKFGLSFWSPEKLTPIYEEIEEILKVTVASENVQSRSGKLFKEGFEKLGYKLHPMMRNAPNCSGSGMCCFGCPTSAKNSADVSFIPMALREGAKILVECAAKKIVWENQKANGVLVKLKNGEEKIIKSKIVIVSAGTVNTPLILKRSKFSYTSSNLCKNVRLHPAAKVMALFDEKIDGYKGIPQGYFSETFENEGFVLEGIFLPPSMVAATLLVDGNHHKKVMDSYKHLAIFGLMVYDESKGKVVGGSWPIKYTLNKKDVAKFKKGLETTAKAFFEAGAYEIFLPLHNTPSIKNIEALDNLKICASDLDLQAFHPLGSCKMGADPKTSVVDPYGRLYGLENIYVADASIFPTSLGVNPMMTIMTAAYRIADKIEL